ncbi:MAG: DUF5011 domain-containing protein [Candidatus Hydrogenedentota bacterium]
MKKRIVGRAVAMTIWCMLLVTGSLFAQENTNPAGFTVTMEGPDRYNQGTNLEMALTIDAENPAGLTALGVQVRAPETWHFVEMETVEGTPPAVQPLPDAREPFDFIWVQNGAFPYTLRMLLRPEETTGGVAMTAIAAYRLDSGELQSEPITIELTDQDIVPPEITLLGDDIIVLEAGDDFTDPWVIATDNEDGDISDSVQVSGAVDPSVVGDYTLTYTVSDAAGNDAAPMTRLVQVVPVGTNVKQGLACSPGGGHVSRHGDVIVLLLTAMVLAVGLGKRLRHVPRQNMVKSSQARSRHTGKQS